MSNKQLLAPLLMLLIASVCALQAQAFTEQAEACGIHLSKHSNGAGVTDFDRDGDLDLYIVASDYYSASNDRTWNRLYRNNGDGTFVDVGEEAGVRSRASTHLGGMMGNKLGMAWGDYNNDGYDDLFLAHIGPDELYLNNGPGQDNRYSLGIGKFADKPFVFSLK